MERISRFSLRLASFASGLSAEAILSSLLRKTSAILHDGQGIFTGLSAAFIATRYHSLIVQEPLPPLLELTASTREGEVMGLRHRHYPTFGVQFHPESILTCEGKRLLQNFLDLGLSKATEETGNGC